MIKGILEFFFRFVWIRIINIYFGSISFSRLWFNVKFLLFFVVYRIKFKRFIVMVILVVVLSVLGGFR